MAQEPIDYELVVADLEAKRAALEAAIAAFRQVLNIGAHVSLGSAVQGASKPIDPATIPDDAFFGLSIGEACKKYLQMVKRKQSVKEIADALDRGGLPHTSSNFAATVATMLNRAAKADPELVRVGRGEWGLAGWYGNRRPKPIERPRKAKRTKATERKVKAVARPQKRKATAHDATKLKTQTATTQPASVRHLATEILREEGGPLHVDEVVKRIKSRSGRKVNKDTLSALFSGAKNRDLFTKTAPNTYGLIA